MKGRRKKVKKELSCCTMSGVNRSFSPFIFLCSGTCSLEFMRVKMQK